MYTSHFFSAGYTQRFGGRIKHGLHYYLGLQLCPFLIGLFHQRQVPGMAYERILRILTLMTLMDLGKVCVSLHLLGNGAGAVGFACPGVGQMCLLHCPLPTPVTLSRKLGITVPSLHPSTPTILNTPSTQGLLVTSKTYSESIQFSLSPSTPLFWTMQ